MIKNHFLKIIFLFTTFIILNNYESLWKQLIILFEQNTTPATRSTIVLNQNKKYDFLTNGTCDAKVLNLSAQCLNLLEQTDANNNKLSNAFYTDCNECLKNNVTNEKLIVYYHVVWQTKNDKHDYQFKVINLNLMSFLATQNLCCTKLIIWKMRSFSKYKKDYLIKTYKYYYDKNYFEFRNFNLRQLCPQAASFKNHAICQNNQFITWILYNTFGFLHPIGLTDFVRFFLLDIYGGIYTDGDFMYLKNMKPLWYLNFAYRWSSSQQINTAVLGLNKQTKEYSTLIKEIILKSKTSIFDLLLSFHPTMRLSVVIASLNNGSVFYYKPLQILHFYLFDPAWLCNDNQMKRLNSKSICYFKEFTQTQFINENEFNPDEFFKGAYGYHLHYYDTVDNFYSKSYFSLFENHFKIKLKIK
jgi:hypothetical protein